MAALRRAVGGLLFALLLLHTQLVVVARCVSWLRPPRRLQQAALATLTPPPSSDVPNALLDKLMGDVIESEMALHT